MAQADIIIKAVVEDAKRKLAEVADSLEGLGDAGQKAAGPTSDLTKNYGQLVGQLREAGSSTREIAEYLGLSRDEMIALGFSAQELTGIFKDQDAELVRMPQYIAGFRGGWLNLITTVALGSSVFILLHRVLEAGTEKLMEGARAEEEYRQKVIETSLSVQEAVKLLEQYRAQKEEIVRSTSSARESLAEEALELSGINEAQQRAADVTAIHKDQLDRFSEAMDRVREQRMKDYYEEGTQAALEQATSVEDLTQRIATLYEIQISEIDATQQEAIAHMYAAHAAEEHEKAITDAARALIELVGMVGSIGGMISELGDIQDRYADRVQDSLFRAEQAWESYQFRVAQTVSAFNFRLSQMDERYLFDRQQALDRASIEAAAAEARFALQIQSIIQDHYDALEDMAFQHWQEMRRELQSAPWYLQGDIQKYIKRREALEKRGDTEGLRRLQRAFMKRLGITDPFYQDEIQNLLKVQGYERYVENREFEQRLKREAAQFAISRSQQEAQLALQLSDREFAYQQQRDALIFNNEQQLAQMKFAYEQQKEASDRAQAEALEDYQKALGDWVKEFDSYAEAMVNRWYDLGRLAGEAYKTGWAETTGGEVPPSAPYKPPKYEPPEWPKRKQAGMPYVPSTMGVVVHPGEAILRADEARRWRGGGEIPITVLIQGPVYLNRLEDFNRLANEISRRIGQEVGFRR